MAVNKDDDISFIKSALQLAQIAFSLGEVPVGAIIVKQGVVIGSGFNRRESDQCATAHAEVIAIESACKSQNSWRLTDTTLYVTLEPCLMCAGAIYQSRIGRVVYGASDPKGGACGSLYSIHSDVRLNHRFTITPNVLEEECSELLKTFFKQKR